MVAITRCGEIVNVKLNKTISGILLFILILYLKQQNNVFCCFYGLKFKDILFVNKLFSCAIFHSKEIQLKRSIQLNMVAEMLQK